MTFPCGFDIIVKRSRETAKTEESPKGQEAAETLKKTRAKRTLKIKQREEKGTREFLEFRNSKKEQKEAEPYKTAIEVSDFENELTKL